MSEGAHVVPDRRKGTRVNRERNEVLYKKKKSLGISLLLEWYGS